MNEVLVEVKKLKENAKLPVFGTEESAAGDLCACIDTDIFGTNQVIIHPGDTRKISTGIAMAIPSGYAGKIYSRSGLSSKYGIAPATKVSVIDSDYRGEIFVALHNHSKEAYTVRNGDRIAQMTIESVPKVKYVEVDELDDTERGEGGFGSTGR